jgi:hypothetical protein
MPDPMPKSDQPDTLPQFRGTVFTDRRYRHHRGDFVLKITARSIPAIDPFFTFH